MDRLCVLTKKKLFCINRHVCFIGLLFFLFAIDGGAEPSVPKATIHGYVVSAKGNVALQYVSVALYQNKDNALVGGVISNSNGHFKIDGLLPGEYYLELSFVGYQNKRIEGVVIDKKKQRVDVGTIVIGESTKYLGEVEVLAERAALEFQLDKKVVNVSEHYTAVSGSAVNVLENVPSLTVDIEGNVSLRGSTQFTVLLDGVPSLLEPSEALRQIPASTIQTIEIITNPSAKYSAEGTAGIINVISKKNSTNGLSGVANGKIGTNNLGADFRLNLQGKKWKGFFGADYNYADYKGDKNGYRKTFNQDSTFTVEHEGGIRTRWHNYNLKGGAELKIDTLNTIAVDFNYGGRNRHNFSDLNYARYNNKNIDEYKYLSHEDAFVGNDGLSVNVYYLHKFAVNAHQLSANVSYKNWEKEAYNKNLLKLDSGAIFEARENTEEGPMYRWQTKLDYTKPMGSKATFEAGYQSTVDSNEDVTRLLEDQDGTGVFMENLPYNNKVKYKRDVHALYLLLGNQLSDFRYQVGLRGEYSKRQVKLVSSGTDRPVDAGHESLDNYDLFPSAHVSYNIASSQEVMASYSKRIERPQGYHFEPFYTWEDAFNIRRGNSALLPEYVDSYELNYLNKMESSYLSLETYYSITHNKIEWVRRVYQDNIIQRSPENVGKDYYLGMDATYSFDLLKWWRVDLMGSFYNYKVKGQWGDYSFYEQRITWNYRVNQTLKINLLTQVQGNWRYYSKRITSQGIYQPVYTFDMALRRDFHKRKVTAVMELRDVFSTNNRENSNRGDGFSDHYFQKIHTPVLTFVITYRFNNYKPFKNRLAGNESLGGTESMER
ncbi:Outer membrane receptor proteins, mostly Fe transport [Saccharicrinis carchari]|uniref:Outer membrane receptor proteins, mostly Fe transport n=1 Tax=Saccharicrinis carchari TaxID=1168039 RepID=A0A521DYE7_SACCC|nr:TonB-dependent receptor [Saccharicrinis carchari]SMO76706.1 Outer membrane receptor proteins, mostly Fe transport [Saccharicrinis carchari]